MQRGKIVDLDSSSAIAAAQHSHVLRLPMADSIILTTARQHQAWLFSMDADFNGLADFELILKMC